jgi:hypothetical protein
MPDCIMIFHGQINPDPRPFEGLDLCEKSIDNNHIFTFHIPTYATQLEFNYFFFVFLLILLSVVNSEKRNSQLGVFAHLGGLKFGDNLQKKTLNFLPRYAPAVVNEKYLWIWSKKGVSRLRLDHNSHPGLSQVFPIFSVFLYFSFHLILFVRLSLLDRANFRIFN